jgi:hypothetical protein
MATISIQEVRAMLKEETPITSFMRQGRGSVIHLSEGDSKENNLLHGVTYSRNGSRASYIFRVSVDSVDSDNMCKKCLQALSTRAELLAAI